MFASGCLARYDQADFVRMDLYNLQLLLLSRKLSDTKVGQIIHDRSDDASAIRAIDMQLNVREEFLILRENRRENIDAGGLIRRRSRVRHEEHARVH